MLILVFTSAAAVIYDYRTNRLGVFSAARGIWTDVRKALAGSGGKTRPKNEFTDKERNEIDKILEKNK